MRIQEVTRQLHLTPWRLTVGFAILLVLATLAIDFVVPLHGNGRTAVDLVELGALLVLFVDVFVNFTRAENKLRFIRQNWFELMLFLPFTFMFKAFRFYEMFGVMGFEAMPLLMRTEIIVKGSHTATQVGRSELFRLTRMTVIGIVCLPDRYKTMKYRGLLSV